MIPIQTATMAPPTQSMAAGLPAPSGLPAIGFVTGAAVASLPLPVNDNPTVSSPDGDDDDDDDDGMELPLDLMHSLRAMGSGELALPGDHDFSDDVWAHLMTAPSCAAAADPDPGAGLGPLGIDLREIMQAPALEE
jgi:heat shock transcription factor